MDITIKLLEILMLLIVAKSSEQSHIQHYHRHKNYTQCSLDSLRVHVVEACDRLVDIMNGYQTTDFSKLGYQIFDAPVTGNRRTRSIRSAKILKKANFPENGYLIVYYPLTKYLQHSSDSDENDLMQLNSVSSEFKSRKHLKSQHSSRISENNIMKSLSDEDDIDDLMRKTKKINHHNHHRRGHHLNRIHDDFSYERGKRHVDANLAYCCKNPYSDNCTAHLCLYA